MKFKNIIGISPLSLRTILLHSLIIACVPAISACQSRELSRSQAQKMITATDDFKQVMTLDYINRYLKEDGKGMVQAIASDEPEDSAIKNRINAYYTEEPRVQIAQHLGFVEPQLKRLNDQPIKNSSLYKYGFWHFDEKWTNTQKGEQLWRDYAMAIQETVVPLAKMQFNNISGMTKITESETGVEFTWRWVPNELGKAFDRAGDEFKALPADIQKNMIENTSKIAAKSTYSWNGDRTGRAVFRKYDDGWRIISLIF